MSDLMRLTGNVEIEAAADGSAKIPRVEILAYTGGEFSPAGWPNCIIDLAGAIVSGEIPLLAGHGDALDDIAGQGRATVRDGQLHVSGRLTEATTAGAKVLALARSGISLQASVGFAPDRREHIRAGDTTRVNGRTIKAGERGLTIIRSGRLREVSMLPIGADPNTQVTIAAKSGANSMKGKPSMNTETTTVEIPDELKAAWDKPGLTDSERVLARWNAARFNEPAIRQQTEKFLHAALAGSLDFAGFEREILKAKVRDLELKAIRDERPMGPEIRASHHDADTLQSAAAGFMLRAGFSGAAERSFGEAIMHAADRMRRGSLLDLCETCLRAEGIEKPNGREAMVKAAFSTVAMPAALGLAGEKILLDAYNEAPAPWREWCKTVAVQSFRGNALLRPSFLGGFEKLAPEGEIAHGHVGEETAVIKADTYAKLLRIDRTQVVNDDAGAFGQAATAMGKAAARKLNDLVISTLLGGVAGNFFTVERNNLLDDALSVTAVASAIAVLRAQTDADGGNLDIVPRVLAVGPALESLAVAICNSDFMGVTDGSPTGNSLKGLLIPVVEPRLANAALGGSATAWAVLAGPGDSPQAVAFLNGQETPTVEALGLDADVDHLSYGWRAYFDFGSALVDWRAAVLSTGAGE